MKSAQVSSAASSRTTLKGMQHVLNCPQSVVLTSTKNPSGSGTSWMGICEPTTVLQGIFGFNGKEQQHNEHIIVRQGLLPHVWLRE